MQKHHILIVEDEDVTRTKMAQYFEAEGYQVACAASGKAMDMLLKKGRFDVVLLDITLPDANGLTLARDLLMNSDMGIVLVTGKHHEIDRIVGLELGVDDYITKPFIPRELVARVRNLIARLSQSQQTSSFENITYRFDGIHFDASKRQLTDRDNKIERLTRAEFELLQVLVTHPNQLLNRDRLMPKVTHRSWNPNDRTIDVLVMRLRRKIERDYKTPTLLTTVHGEGYMLSCTPERIRN